MNYLVNLHVLLSFQFLTNKTVFDVLKIVSIFAAQALNGTVNDHP